MLLNRSLTVRPGHVRASHRGRGWEEVTSCAIEALVRRGGPCVADPVAATRRGSRRCSARPGRRVAAPVAASASRGFFGSRPFQPRERTLLEHQGASRWMATAVGDLRAPDPRPPPQ